MTRVAQWTLGSLSLPQIAQASLTPRQKSGDSYLVILVLVVVLASLSELFGFLCSWIFDVFDEDGGGTIELDEVIKLVKPRI